MKKTLTLLFLSFFALHSGLAAAQVSRLDEVLKSGKLRICMTGDYKPFSYQRADGTFEGMDVDLGASLAKAMGVEAQFVKTTWTGLMNDFIEKCDIAMGGVSITLERLKRAGFAESHLLDGKSAIARCADAAKFQSLAAIDQPTTRAIVNPGGTNELFARAHFKQAQLIVHNDNVTIFDQIVQGKADVMVTDSSETLWQSKQHPELCAIHPDKPLQFAEKAFMLPRGDVPFKTWIDAWMHMQKETGSYQQVFNKWLK
ncbi:transporter substrate-binding domain-containing protein [Undibacterium sp.]|uniref:transporter substrate-binding domain-containing protein n=1 Tax=Undibacterium sp. TaxID=1914977 RepID=UPI002CC4BE7A|nr:transporter substrate-binding domain-containing protein [Undibacterium sp.]HTD03343.1 transporter substrate-binding domain-containing protein [Undibacterium sp.]